MVAWCAVAHRAVVAADIASSEVQSIQAVLDLPGDGFLVGVLADAPTRDEGARETLLWRSPAFSEPFEFALDAVLGIRFPLPVDEPPAGSGAWCVELVSGDALVGEIESIDGKSVAMAIGGAAAPIGISVGREAVGRIVRLGRGDSYAGPAGLAGWAAGPSGSWREEAGRLAADTRSQLFRALGCGPRCRYDITLSWSTRPSIQVALGVGGPQAAAPYRLDLGPAGLVAVRQEEAAADLEPVGELPEKGISLSVFVDERAGRMAVMLPGGDKPVADLMIPPPAQRAGGGFRLALREGAVVIDSLRVSPWLSGEPSLEPADAPSIRLEDGTVVAGRVTSMNRKSGFGVVEKGGEVPSRWIPAERIVEINCGTGPRRPPEGMNDAAVSLRVADLWGSRLSGVLKSVERSAVEIAHPAIDAPVVMPFENLARVTSLRRGESPRALPGRIGRLDCDTARMRGCLVPGGKAGAGDDGRGAIAWQPVGSLGASPLASPGGGQPQATITYVETVPQEPGKGGVLGGIGAHVMIAEEGPLITSFVGAPANGLQPGSVILEIDPRGDGRFVKTAGLPLDDVQHLLRGEVGSSVCLRCRIHGAKNVNEVRVKRRSIGQDAGLLQQALAAQERLVGGAPATGEEAAGTPFRSLLILRSGETVPCRVESIGEEGVRLTMKDGEPITVPHDVVQALELVPTPGQKLSREKFRSLTTLPRTREEQPPTHLLRSKAGDYLRGRVVSLDGETVRLAVEAGLRAKPLSLPRADVTRVIWLHPESMTTPWQAPQPATDGGLAVEAVTGETARLGLLATGIEGDVLLGTKPFIGPCRVDLQTVRALLVGGASDGRRRSMPFSQWRLVPAADPRNLPPRKRAESGADSADRPPATDVEQAAPGLPLPARRGDRATAEAAALAEADRLADARDRRAVAAYAALLLAEDRVIRTRSIAQLGKITGTPLPYGIDDPTDKRETAARDWRRWAARQAVSAPLRFLRNGAGARGRSLAGRMLVCRSNAGDVVEYDDSGAETFRAAMPSPWACDVAPQGHRLVGSYGGKFIVEFDETGKEVGRIGNLVSGVMSVRGLEDGHVLATLADANQVVEFDPAGKVVWQVVLPGRPCDARRLPDGRTLVALHRANRIVEVDRAGKVVWAVEDLPDPQTAQRLPNGNTLVALTTPGIAREIDRDGREVWSREGFQFLVDVQRLPDGRTLCVEQGGTCIELDAEGKEIGRTSHGSASRAIKY